MQKNCPAMAAPNILEDIESILDRECLENNNQSILKAKQILNESASTNSNEGECTDLLKTMLNMFCDPSWKTNSKNRKRILNVINYFIEHQVYDSSKSQSNSLIDPCLLVKTVSERLKPQLESYNQFIQAKENSDEYKNLEYSDWLSMKRRELFNRVSCPN